MIGRAHLVAALAAAALTGAGCYGAGSGPLAVTPTPYLITIDNYRFIPADLEVPPGATVLVRNNDYIAHWLQSAAAPGQYAHAAVGGVDLDLYVRPRTEETFAVPAAAAVGTVVPYFCVLASRAMLDQGQLTIVAAPP